MSRLFPTICIAAILLLSSIACSRQNISAPSAANTRERQQTGLNINKATAAELERLPSIGEKLAARIVEYRTEHGPFRRPEELMLVQGISDAKFREIRALIDIE